MEEKIYLFAGNKVTLEEFAKAYKDGDMDAAAELMKILIQTGKAQEMPCTNISVGERLIQEALKAHTVIDAAEVLTDEETAEKKYRADKKRENKLTYDEVAFDFPTVSKAEDFEAQLAKMFIYSKVAKNSDTQLWEVIVPNITEKDLSKATTLYKSQRMVTNTLHTVDDVANKTVGAVSYASERVVVPTVQVAGKAGMSIFKTLAKTAAKTTGTLTSAVVHGLRDTIHEVKTDPDVIKASADLKKTTYDVKNSLGGTKAAKAGSGIHFR